MSQRPIHFTITRRAAITGIGATMTTPGMAYAQLGLGRLFHSGNNGNAPNAEPAQPKLGRQGLLAGGYSQRFEPVRVMLAQGDYADALAAFIPPPPPPAASAQAAGTSGGGTPAAAASASAGAGAAAAGKPAAPAPTKSASATKPATDVKPGAEDEHAKRGLTHDKYLTAVEAGLINFESGSVDDAITHWREAEDIRAKSNSAGRVAGSIVGMISGQNELAPYRPLDHEGVMQLNFLAVAHMFKGQPTCYNVARRCIEFQKAQKQRWDKEIEDYKSKQQQAAAKPAQPTQPSRNDKVSAEDSQKSQSDFEAEYTKHDDIADRVPNAYVNPLGDYLAGLICEIASREQEALRDNALIAYKSALDLCGGSPHLSAAITAMKRPRTPPRERVVHVMVGEGFAPERRELVWILGVGGQIVPVRVPFYAPIESPIVRIEAMVGAIKPIKLDPIGDFEAIRMRSQKDRAPLEVLEVISSVVLRKVRGSLLNHIPIVGGVINAAAEVASHADTRAWLSLPRRFHVARIVLPPKASKVDIVSRGANGQQLAKATVALVPDVSHSVVYARAIGNRLVVQNARRLWIDGKVEIDAHA